MASGPITSWQIDGETVEAVADFILGAPKSLQMVIAAMKLWVMELGWVIHPRYPNELWEWKESYDQPR